MNTINNYPGAFKAESVAREMNLARLRRQVYTIGKWAHKNRQQVIEDWANHSVEFLEQQISEIARKVSQLRADKASVDAQLADLRAQMQTTEVTLDD